MFPLPGVFLYPNAVLPLHIFEPRYRQMIDDVLDGPGRIVLATIPPGEVETPQRPPLVLPVAGLGEIVRHEKLPDGRFLIWLLGLGRVRIREVDSDRLYRRVRCQPFAEAAPLPPEADRLRVLLRTAAETRLEKPLPLPADTPTAVLADLLVQTLQAPVEQLAAFYSEPSVAVRAERALQLHLLAGQAAPRPRSEPLDGATGGPPA
jgi:Lon protease-like protein